MQPHRRRFPPRQPGGKIPGQCSVNEVVSSGSEADGIMATTYSLTVGGEEVVAVTGGLQDSTIPETRDFI